MREGFTVKAIAERICRSPSVKERTRLIERVRYWSRDQWLIPLGDPKTGSGRWRSYPERTIYVAAVLYELSRYALSRGVMSDVAAALNAGLGIKQGMHFRKGMRVDLVTNAVEGVKQVFMTVGFPGDADLGEGVTVVRTDIGFHEKQPALPARSGIALNLTNIFREGG